MTKTWIQNAFLPFKSQFPRWISNTIRNSATAILTPIIFSWRTSHFKSSYKMAAVSKKGDPLPWYSYPCIDFLKHRSYENRSVLEFGAGQSTVWWAQRAKRVVALEEDELWLQKLKTRAPSNVELHLVPIDTPDVCVEEVNRVLCDQSGIRFDVIVIDGIWRYEMIDIADRLVSEEGIIICDNSKAYGIYEGFKDRDFERIDFLALSLASFCPIAHRFSFARARSYLVQNTRYRSLGPN